MIEDIKEEKSNTPGFEGEVKQSHPSFGMIGISNCNGDTHLFGSSVKHQHYITLEIKTATKTSSAYAERYFGDKTICSVSLSHSQLAEMLFKSNHGDGVPCTISYVIHEGRKPQMPEDTKSHLVQAQKHVHDELNDVYEKAVSMCSEVEKIVESGMSKKADRDRVKFLAYKIKQDIEANLSFAHKCFDEKMEKSISQAKAEIETFVNAKFREAGIEAIKGQNLLNDTVGRKRLERR